MDLLTQADNQSLSIGDFLSISRKVVADALPTCWIVGEVANFTCAASGHWYFVLRDAEAQADCVMLRQHNALLPMPLANGDAVEVLAQADIYVPRGRFQLAARFVRHIGDGRWHQLYARRKKEWAARGWFDGAKKTPPPFLPTVIGIVGSLEGAAVRDVIRTLKIRMPTVHVIVYPAPAQGAEAAAKIAAAIEIANRRGECETLIVCRGGGNMEDLWAFNEEAVVAAIVHSDLPVISGIGHEIDETLSDLAADVRAPTPTGAAIFAVPDRAELNEKWQNAADIFTRALARTLADKAQQLDWSAAAFVRPSALLEGKIAHQQRLAASFLSAAVAVHANARLHLQTVAARLRCPPLSPQMVHWRALAARLSPAAKYCLQNTDVRLRDVGAIFRACNPKNTLARGYSIVCDGDGKAVVDGGGLRCGDNLHITFARGSAQATVSRTKKDK